MVAAMHSTSPQTSSTRKGVQTTSYDAAEAIGTEGAVAPPITSTSLQTDNTSKRVKKKTRRGRGKKATKKVCTSNSPWGLEDAAEATGTEGKVILALPPISVQANITPKRDITSPYNAAEAIGTESKVIAAILSNPPPTENTPKRGKKRYRRRRRTRTQEASTSNSEAHQQLLIDPKDHNAKRKRENSEPMEEARAFSPSSSSSGAQSLNPKRQKQEVPVDTVREADRFLENLAVDLQLGS
ncbi:MAG: hypothetical protein Q9191_002389 [Dirinaria sp. TL-2023a]